MYSYTVFKQEVRCVLQRSALVFPGKTKVLSFPGSSAVADIGMGGFGLCVKAVVMGLEVAVFPSEFENLSEDGLGVRGERA